MKISELYPQELKKSLIQTGKNFIETIGEAAVKDAVVSILSGDNVRESTEVLTRRRLALSNGAILAMFLNGCSHYPDFLDNLSEKTIEELQRRNSKEDKWILQWILGLTDK